MSAPTIDRPTARPLAEVLDLIGQHGTWLDGCRVGKYGTFACSREGAVEVRVKATGAVVLACRQHARVLERAGGHLFVVGDEAPGSLPHFQTYELEVTA